MKTFTTSSTARLNQIMREYRGRVVSVQFRTERRPLPKSYQRAFTTRRKYERRERFERRRTLFAGITHRLVVVSTIKVR